jgi:hypothetical protein
MIKFEWIRRPSLKEVEQNRWDEIRAEVSHSQFNIQKYKSAAYSIRED